eukprot:TRINITY_DN87633_c0_g1_i1.p1 TRINITY_DN87633_c0_g1~~TRINITY_DN87633_c0_g1_i1.p1  ORF type:complete len:272 (+),score=47.24 TRINITY_DN87633_c0_g1_i1:42-818(+)
MAASLLQLRLRRRPSLVTGLLLLAGLLVVADEAAFCSALARPGQARGRYLARRAGKLPLKVDGKAEPLGNYILVKVDEVEEMSKGGILLPKSEKPKAGEVVAVGPGEVHSKSGKPVPVTVKPRTKVLYSKYSGSEIINLDGHDHVLVREDDILAGYEGEVPSPESLTLPRGKVLVKLLAEEKETSGGLLLSTGPAATSSTDGQVISVGPGQVLHSGEEIPPPVKAGDMVRFRYGDEVDLDFDNEKYSVVRVSNCLAKW